MQNQTTTEINNKNKHKIDNICNENSDSVVYIDCSEEVPSYEYCTYIGSENGNLMEQFLNQLYLKELYDGGVILYDVGSQANVRGRVVFKSVLIEGKQEWLIDYMDFCAVSPIPKNIIKFLGE